MPNHVTNNLTLSVDSENANDRLNEILALIKTDNGDIGVQHFDFANIIPQPENLFTDNLGKHERELCTAEGRPNWYDWNCENWGTKWNAYEVDIGEVEYGCVDIQFDTAWSAPFPVIEALRFMFHDLHVSGHWVEEGHQSAGVF